MGTVTLCPCNSQFRIKHDFVRQLLRSTRLSAMNGFHRRYVDSDPHLPPIPQVEKDQNSKQGSNGEIDSSEAQKKQVHIGVHRLQETARLLVLRQNRQGDPAADDDDTMALVWALHARSSANSG